MNNKIIKVVKDTHKKYRQKDTSVSKHTKSALVITKEWQNIVCTNNDFIGAEEKVSNDNNEKIDIVDFKNQTAYELKVSGKNPHHEFYKDLVKVLTYNLNKEKKLKKFIFITEGEGIDSLQKRLDDKFLKMIEDTHKISIELVKVDE
jgi:hypothetical protein